MNLVRSVVVVMVVVVNRHGRRCSMWVTTVTILANIIIIITTTNGMVATISHFLFVGRDPLFLSDRMNILIDYCTITRVIYTGIRGWKNVVFVRLNVRSYFTVGLQKYNNKNINQCCFVAALSFTRTYQQWWMYLEQKKLKVVVVVMYLFLGCWCTLSLSAVLYFISFLSLLSLRSHI